MKYLLMELLFNIAAFFIFCSVIYFVGVISVILCDRIIEDKPKNKIK